MATDEALMLAFQRGSREAFEELFVRHRQALYGFFRRRLDSRERAEDLTQETFLAVIRASARYQPRALVRTWVYGIAMNLLAAERRRRTTGELTAASEPSTPGSLDEALCVREALSRLDAVDREVLMLREYEQLTYFEIAELLRLPLNTVRSRLFRARLALKNRLTAEEA
jgi:RNA polymerase sigma-70 factor (ECF subfamily)